jgi:DnaJ-class molecular chaperone
MKTCEKCKGTGCLTDENGIVSDDVCPECDGSGTKIHFEED